MPDDIHDQMRAALAFERNQCSTIVEEARKRAEGNRSALAALDEVAAAIEQRRLFVGHEYKRGTVGGANDRYRLVRGLGCTCCPHPECICESTCEHRCPVHAPIEIATLEAEVERLKKTVRDFLVAGGMNVDGLLDEVRTKGAA